MDAVGATHAHRVAELERAAPAPPPSNPSRSASSTSALARSCSARPVSSTSEDVRPMMDPAALGRRSTRPRRRRTRRRRGVSRARARARPRRRTRRDRGTHARRPSAPRRAPPRPRPRRARSRASSRIRASSDQIAETSGTSYAVDHSFRPSARSSLNFQSLACTSSSPDPEDLGREDRGVHRGVDPDRRDRHARRHLRGDRKRLVADHLRRRRDRDPDHRQHRPRGDRRREVARQPGRADQRPSGRARTRSARTRRPDPGSGTTT